jgi:hypothetical protein
MDVWRWTMGLRQQLKYRHPTKVPVQNAQIYDRCAMVCIKLHASQRSWHSIHQRCYAREKQQTSWPCRGASQPTPAVTNSYTIHDTIKQKNPSVITDILHNSLSCTILPLNNSRIW